MYQEVEVIPAQEALQERMLFVRFNYILTTMVRAPIVAVCFFLLALSSFVQYALSSPKVLDFTIYADGTTHVFYQTDVDPQSPASASPAPCPESPPAVPHSPPNPPSSSPFKRSGGRLRRSSSTAR